MTLGPVLATTPVFFLDGNNGYRIQGGLVSLFADRIQSPGNFSGDLSLQLWACEAPFSGNQLVGHQLATVTLGTLFSGNAFVDAVDTVVGQVPTSGTFHMVLALVESQNGASYIHDWRGYALTETFASVKEIDHPELPAAPVEGVSADDVNEAIEALKADEVAHPMESKAAEKAQQSDTTKQAEKPAVDATKVARDATAKPVEKPAKKETPTAAKPTNAAESAPATKSTNAAESAPAAKTSKVAETATAAATAPKAKTVEAQPKQARTLQPVDARVDVNKAKAEEIAAVKGVTKPMAQRIIEGRPYRKLEELLNVKGIGQQLLDRIRKYFKI